MNLTLILIGIIGILAGGIINMLADDLPRRRSPSLPKYPDGSPRPLLAWLGITAFLFQRRASTQGTRLSWRYPLTELATALLMMWLFLLKSDDPNVNDLQLMFWLIYVAILVLITIIDVEHRLILFVVIIPTAVLVIIEAILTPNYPPQLQGALIGGGVGFIVFFLFYMGGYLFTYITGQLRGKQINTVAFGYGDVMLITVSGLMVGIQSIVLVIFIAIFFGALGAVVYLVGQALLGKRYSWFTALPYGPYIVAATLLVLFYTLEVQKAMLGYCNPIPC